MTARGQLLLAVGSAMCTTAGIGILLGEVMPFWPAVVVTAVVGLILGVVAVCVTPPRRSRRTKHRRGQ